MSVAPANVSNTIYQEALASESQSRIIWSSNDNIGQPSGCTMVVGRHRDEQLYSEVLSVRQKTDPRWKDQTAPVDQYSDHYCVFVDQNPVASLGVTRLVDGPIFLNEYCPPELLEEFKDCLCSAFRFRILSNYRRGSRLVPGISISRHLVREAWRDQIKKGIKLDVINIESTHIPLYQRMGYELCDGYTYVDPILGTSSGIMYLATDPDKESIIQDIVKESGQFLSTATVHNCLTRTVFGSDRKSAVN